MRGAPQVGFSATMRKIKARIALLTGFRPPTRLALDIHVQYSRKPARCQPVTVLGVTRMRGFLQPDVVFPLQLLQLHKFAQLVPPFWVLSLVVLLLTADWSSVGMHHLRRSEERRVGKERR